MNKDNSCKNRIEVLEQLIDELMKDTPKEDLVRTYMEKTGIPYSDDPILRLNSVLTAMHSFNPQMEV